MIRVIAHTPEGGNRRSTGGTETPRRRDCRHRLVKRVERTAKECGLLAGQDNRCLTRSQAVCVGLQAGILTDPSGDQPGIEVGIFRPQPPTG
jgi:hypothetical protein